MAPTSAGDRPKWQVPGRCHGYPAPWARTCEAERILRGQIKTFVSFRRKKLPGAIPPPGRDRLPGFPLPFLPEPRKQRPELTHPVAGGRPPGRRVRHSCLTFVQGPGPPRASRHRAPGGGRSRVPISPGFTFRATKGEPGKILPDSYFARASRAFASGSGKPFANGGCKDLVLDATHPAAGALPPFLLTF